MTSIVHGPNLHGASNPLHPDWPTEAGEVVGRIESAIGVAPGSYMGRVSMAAAVGKTDLKTELRRLYSALGGVRSHYDPNADELRALYAGTVTAASLMAKAGTPEAAHPLASPTPAKREAQFIGSEPELAATAPEAVAEPKAERRSLTKGAGNTADVAALLAQLLATRRSTRRLSVKSWTTPRRPSWPQSSNRLRTRWPTLSRSCKG
jgi:hypothetical protein